MTTLFNNFQEGSSGTTVTTGNSSGADGSNAFDGVTIGSSAVVAFSSTEAISGHGETLSCKISTPSTATTAFVDWLGSIGATPPAIYFRAYLYFTANPSAQHRLFFVSTAGSTNFSAQLNSSGKLIVAYGSSGTNFVVFTATIPLNAWFRVEGFVIFSATVGQVSGSLYDTIDSTTATETHTSTATLNTGTSGTTTASFGCSSSLASVGPFYMTDIGLSTTGALGPSQFTGSPSAALTLAATAAGSRSQPGAVTGAVSLSAAAVGKRQQAKAASAALTLAASATGSSSRPGAPSAALTLAASATGSSKRPGSPSAVLSLAAAAAGSRQQAKAVTAALALTATAAGTVITVSTKASSVPSVGMAAASAPSVTRGG